MRIAIMQPYYYPYAGYFRLFAATDLFVILDSVQWSRRGRVHRYNIDDEKWVTLPIEKSDRDTTMIKDLKWRAGEEKEREPCDYIIGKLADVCERLALPFECARASSLHIDDTLRGQDRIIAICKKLGATEYINSPGGRTLYDEQMFKANGIKLTFLPEWQGSYDSIIERLAHEKPEYIKREIYAQI
jgi:hypothetical protein